LFSSATHQNLRHKTTQFYILLFYHKKTAKSTHLTYLFNLLIKFIYFIYYLFNEYQQAMFCQENDGKVVLKCIRHANA